MSKLENSGLSPALGCPPLAAASLPARSILGSDHGVIRHAEHLADLVLAQGGTTANLFHPIELVFQEWTSAFQRGVLPRINEKIDGSPAIVTSFTKRGTPFVAYKGGFLSTTSQSLFTHERQINLQYDRGHPLRTVYTTCLEVLRPRLLDISRREPTRWGKAILQGDVLFCEGDGRKEVTPEAVTIRANEIQYRIPHSSPLYAQAAGAKMGIAFHTIARRETEPGSSRISAEPSHDDEQLRAISRALISKDLFVIDPFQEPTPLLKSPEEFSRVCASTDHGMRLVDRLLETVRADDTFRTAWQAGILDKARQFFNAQLKSGGDGGIFRDVRDNRAFDPEKYITAMIAWIAARALDERQRLTFEREPKTTFILFAEKFDQFLAHHRSTFATLLHAYYITIQLQDTVHRFAESGMKSVLGGGPIEGLVMRTGPHVVKWVDRLGFTTANNIRHRTTDLPAPFDAWRPGTFFIPGKFQPLHPGHVAFIQQATLQAGNAPVVVVASPQQPRLTARTWEGMKVTKKKEYFNDLQFTYVFSRKLRERIIRASLPKGTDVRLVYPKHLWAHIQRAHHAGLPGQVNVVLGQKELDTGRYRQQINSLGSSWSPVSIAMQSGGISATQIRMCVRAAALDETEEKRQAVVDLLPHITSVKSRNAIARAMIQEYKKVIARAQRILALEKHRQSVKKKPRDSTTS